MKHKLYLQVLLTVGMTTALHPVMTALAAETDTQELSFTQQTQQAQPASTQQVQPASASQQTAPAQPTDSTVSGPYDQTFIVSAYYSPIANQDKYVTGSYSGDIRLNGNGVHGADGSDVYPGMIAAPKNYPFGTKLKIPGIGVVAVHDRGGAIVNAGQRNQSHDRLDVWMGFGDAGLQRALHWGRRTVQVTVYGIDPSIQEAVNLEGYSEAEKVVQEITGDAPQTFTQDLSVNDQNDSVKKLQDGLRTLGYYNGQTTGEYDDATKQAVIKFQVATGIVDTADDFGAGYFGPQTRQTLEDTLQNKQDAANSHLPQKALSRDDQGDDVRKLQEDLKKLGYDVEATGIYDTQTIDAIFKFQKDQKIVVSESDFGAGNFGPKTMQILASKLQGVTFDTANAQEATVTPVVIFTKDLKYGDKGDDVRRLQEELKNMNFLGIDPSGYYGEVTQHAVYKFQQSQNLVDTMKDPGAGYFGTSSRNRMHSLIGERQRIDGLLAQQTPAKKEDAVALK